MAERIRNGRFFQIFLEFDAHILLQITKNL